MLVAVELLATTALVVATELGAAELLALDEVTLLVTELARLLLDELVAGVQLVDVGKESGVSPVRFTRKLLAGTFNVIPSENTTYCELQP